MHGVSNAFMERAFPSFGFAPFTAVKEQASPDPEFPTVKFPNPEEKGALVCSFCTTCLSIRCQMLDRIWLSQLPIARKPTTYLLKILIQTGSPPQNDGTSRLSYFCKILYLSEVQA